MVKNCSKCGAQLEDLALFCPNCGQKVESNSTPPPRLEVAETQFVPRSTRRMTDHLSTGYNIAISNPLVFLPAIVGGLLSTLTSYVSGTTYQFDGLSTILWLLGAFISFILSFASLDISRDAYNRQTLDVGQSIAYVFSRISTFLIASIFGALLSITIVFIPVVTLTFTLMVLDEAGIMDSFSKAFKVLQADLGDVILVILLSIVGNFLLGYLPLVSTLLVSILNVIVGLAFIDIVMSYEGKESYFTPVN